MLLQVSAYCVPPPLPTVALVCREPIFEAEIIREHQIMHDLQQDDVPTANIWLRNLECAGNRGHCYCFYIFAADKKGSSSLLRCNMWLSHL